MKEWRKKNPERYLWTNAKIRATRDGVEFSISPDDIKIPEFCPVLGIKLEPGGHKGKFNSPSLDRRDNTRGYTPDNIAVISLKANNHKGNLTVEEVRSLLTYMEITDVLDDSGGVRNLAKGTPQSLYPPGF